MPTVIRATVERLRLPLERPYVLSFTTLVDFDTIVGRIEWDDGRTTTGEVVPLPGYTPESTDEVEQTARALAEVLPGTSIDDARRLLESRQRAEPSACSVWSTALDLYDWSDEPEPIRVPVVWPCSSSNRRLGADVRRAVAEGYRTIKVKVGRAIDDDVNAVERLSAANLPDDVTLRFDANQAFSPEEAARFVAALEEHLPERTELLEQPFAPDDWDSVEWLIARTTIPVMQDESINNRADVRRAADVGARLVKFKLCKHGGPAAVIALAESAAAWGLELVLGNGVATDVANRVELGIQSRRPDLFPRASEANGFAKVARRLRHPDLRIEHGAAVTGPVLATPTPMIARTRVLT